MSKHDITETLRGFFNLAEFRDFLDEQINDGQEISRGKDPNDKSKEEKKEAESDAPEGGEEEPEAPVVDPTNAPGSQVTIGNKDKDVEADPDAVSLKVSGKKDKINMKPIAKIDPSNGFDSTKH